jgi:hypothetical protein
MTSRPRRQTASKVCDAGGKAALRGCRRRHRALTPWSGNAVRERERGDSERQDVDFVN